MQLDDTRIASGSSDSTIKVVWAAPKLTSGLEHAHQRTMECPHAAWTSWSGATVPLCLGIFVVSWQSHNTTSPSLPLLSLPLLILRQVRCLHMRGSQIVSGAADGAIRVWDLADGPGWSRGSCRLTILGHTGFFPLPSLLQPHHAITTFARPSFPPHALRADIVRCLHADGAVAVSGSYDATLRVWDLHSGQCLHVLRYPSVFPIAMNRLFPFHPDARGHEGAVLSVQCDAAGIVSGGMDTNIKVPHL